MTKTATRYSAHPSARMTQLDAAGTAYTVKIFCAHKKEMLDGAVIAHDSSWVVVDTLHGVMHINLANVEAITIEEV